MDNTYDLLPNTPEWDDLIGTKEIPETHEYIKDNLEFDYHCECYLNINDQIRHLELQKKSHHERILQMSKNMNSCSNSFKASKFKVKGSVDTKTLYDAYEINEEVLDIYRKDGREQWRITKN